MLRAARHPIEWAFGGIKASWGILTRNIDLHLMKMPTHIIVCSVLHNYCESTMILLDEEQERVQSEKNRENANIFSNIPDLIFRDNCRSARN